MNETAKKLLFMSRGKQRYGTAGTTTTTPLASQGGLLINIDSATGDTARTTTGYLENNSALGLYARQDTAGWSVEADTAVARTGSKTLKISTTTTAGGASVIIGADNRDATYVGTRNRLYPLKASTKYKVTCWAKTTGVAAASVFLTAWEWNSTYTGRVFNVSNTLTGTNDWTLLTVTFTTNAATTQGTISVANSVAGNVSDAWFDINSMTLEEVIEPVANSLVTPSPSLVSFTAVGSTGNIDQSQLTVNGGSALGNAAGLSYMESQSFTATKSKLTGVYLYKRANTLTPTGNLKVDIRTNNAGDPSTTILATYTIPLATYNALTTNAEYLVNLPCNLTTGTLYHIVVSNTAIESAGNYFNIGNNSAGGYAGGDQRYSTDGGTVWVVNGTADLYFKTLYYKPTTNFKASQNNSTVSISADEDGFLDGAVLGLTTGNFSVSKTYINNTPELAKNDNYSFTTTGAVGLLEAPTAGIPIATTFGVNNLVYKINSAYALNSVTLTLTPNVSAGRSFKVQYSPDNGVTPYVDVYTYTNADTLIATSSTIAIASLSTFYLRFVAAVNICYIRSFSLSGSINTSSVNGVLKNYPTNKDIIKQYATTLSGPTISATYRATKWGFPAIEYSATEYQFLDVDTTATGSTVAFSELGTTYTTVADGASLAISSTSTPNIFVKANITANRLYSSSNDYVANSDKDGSLRQTLTYQVIQ